MKDNKKDDPFKFFKWDIVKELIKKYPNDQQLGEAIRKNYKEFL